MNLEKDSKFVICTWKKREENEQSVNVVVLMNISKGFPSCSTYFINLSKRSGFFTYRQV